MKMSGCAVIKKRYYEKGESDEEICESLASGLYGQYRDECSRRVQVFS